MLMQISILLQNKILSSILKKVQKISEPFLFLGHIKNISHGYFYSVFINVNFLRCSAHISPAVNFRPIR